jgi:EmrB/QacA subfamily drug resistance transporter
MPRHPRVAVAVIYAAAMFMATMDLTIVNVALPAIGRSFGEPLSALGTPVLAYTASLAVFIPFSAWVGERLGHGRVMLLSLAMFTLASAACGLSRALPELVLARIAQGAAGALIETVGLALLLDMFPAGERVRVMKLLTVPAVFAPAIGPVAGGFLVEHLSWHWIFLVNVPPGLLVLGYGLLALPRGAADPAREFDLLGCALSGGGLAGVLTGLSLGSAAGWNRPAVYVAVGGGLAAVAGFIVRRGARVKPIVDLTLLGDRWFRSVNLTSLYANAAFMGIVFAFPIYLQQARHATPFAAGLTTCPEALGVIVSTQLAARAMRRLRPHAVIAVGMVVVTGASATLMLAIGRVPSGLLAALMFTIGSGMAWMFLPSSTSAFDSVPKVSQGDASALFAVQVQLSNVLGVAILATVISQVAAHSTSPTFPYRAAFATAALLALLATLSTRLIPKRPLANV